MGSEILAVGVPEAGRRLGVSTRTVNSLIGRGELFSRKIGRRRVVPISALEKLLQDHGEVKETEVGSAAHAASI